MPPEPARQAKTNVAWAFVTPSYSGDYDRCLLLCRSMDVFLSGNWHHYLIVDKPHYEMFKHLESERRSVWLTENVVPVKMRLLFNVPFLGGRSVWWSSQTGISIGWHMQQMVKIGMAQKVSQDGLAYVDSDVFFLRPFSTDQMVRDGRLRFYKTTNSEFVGDAGSSKYLRVSLKMLGLPMGRSYRGYIDNFVTWHRQEVLALCAYLAGRFGGTWYRAFRNRIQLSEYMLYGLYADEVDETQDRLYTDHRQLCRTIWDDEGLAGIDIAGFCQNLEPHQVTIGVQSFLGVDVKILEEQFDLAKAKYLKPSPRSKNRA